MAIEGFVVSDKNRRAVFIELMTAGPSRADRLVKRLRLVRAAAERAIADLEAQKLVERAGTGEIRLTEEGLRVAHDLKRQDLLS
jgi:Mn-dependent DtxR family transcriptional regulator